MIPALLLAIRCCNKWWVVIQAEDVLYAGHYDDRMQLGIETVHVIQRTHWEAMA